MYQCNSGFSSLEVETLSVGTFVYVGDYMAGAIIVHDVTRQKFWKMGHPQMLPNPDNAFYKIANVEYVFELGLMSLNLAPSRKGSLHFHALSSLTENKIKTADLRNESLSSNPYSAVYMSKSIFFLFEFINSRSYKSDQGF